MYSPQQAIGLAILAGLQDWTGHVSKEEITRTMRGVVKIPDRDVEDWIEQRKPSPWHEEAVAAAEASRAGQAETEADIPRHLIVHIDRVLNYLRRRRLEADRLSNYLRLPGGDEDTTRSKPTSKRA
jgi:hypothetical protein